MCPRKCHSPRPVFLTPQSTLFKPHNSLLIQEQMFLPWFPVSPPWLPKPQLLRNSAIERDSKQPQQGRLSPLHSFSVSLHCFGSPPVPHSFPFLLLFFLCATQRLRLQPQSYFVSHGLWPQQLFDVSLQLQLCETLLRPSMFVGDSGSARSP